MGKTLKTIAIVAAAVAVVIFAPEIAAAIGIKAITAATVAAVGASIALSTASMALFGPKIPKTQISRLNVSLDPSTPRKAVFGTTAMPLDLRYHESSGTDQEYVDYIIAVAAHKVASITEIWFEEKQAWTLAGGVTGTYSGYLTVAVRTEGTAANYISINGGGKWGSTRRLTGCAYLHLRIKRTGADKKAESPLVGGLPSRVTVIGDGAPLYDPRKDSTVPGGSGSHRATDQSTWGAYTNADDTDNPALQLLWWLLGWEINNKLSIGCGVPYTRIDMESFITAANICDENVTLATGGTQKRYRTSGTASDADDRMEIINNLLASMNGTLRDNGGKLTITAMKNDLADYVLTFNEGDMLGEFDWQQTRGLTESHNIARGRYVDPSANSLYQMVDYPEVGFAAPDGIERVMSLDLPYVEDGRRAQRIAKQVLQRNQYRGMFSTTFNAKALGCQVGDVVRVSLEALGWSNKLFRVVSQEIRFDGQVPMALVEENAAIYAWDADDVAPITPTAPTIYNPLNSPFILGIDVAGTTADWSAIVDDNGDKPENNATRNVNRGEWSASSIEYFVGDFVQRDGPTYSVTVAHTSTSVNGPPGVNWSLLASGGDGTPGLNSASVFLYKRATSAPAVPASTLTYTFATGVLTGTLDGWTQTVPSGTDPIYVTLATAVSTSPTDTIATSEWSAVSILAQNGTSGTNGLNNAVVYLYQRATTAPAAPSGTFTYTFSTGVLSGGTPGSWTQAIPAVNGNPLWVIAATASSSTATDSIAAAEFSSAVKLVQDGADGTNGADGADGTPAITGYLTNEAVQLFAYANGGVVSYSPATGSFKVFSGNTDVSSSFSLSTLSNPQALTVSYASQAYSVTGGFDASEDTATLTIRATGSGTYTGVTIDKVFSLSKAKGGYEIVATLPTTNLFEGRVVFLTTDDKLYRYTGSAWTTAVPAVDISGTLADAQIAALAASKITGQLSDSQLAAIAAAKLTGQITGTQITDGAITTAKLSAGSVTSNEIAANTIVAADIASGTITATQIAAATITGAKIAAGTIAAGNIAANTITASEIAANTITAGQIASNAITADEIATGAVTAAKINVTELSAITATIGTLRTATTGARLEIESNQIRVYDGSNVLRVRLGIW